MAASLGRGGGGDGVRRLASLAPTPTTHPTRHLPLVTTRRPPAVPLHCLALHPTRRLPPTLFPTPDPTPNPLQSDPSVASHPSLGADSRLPLLAPPAPLAASKRRGGQVYERKLRLAPPTSSRSQITGRVPGEHRESTGRSAPGTLSRGHVPAPGSLAGSLLATTRASAVHPPLLGGWWPARPRRAPPIVSSLRSVRTRGHHIMFHVRSPRSIAPCGVDLKDPCGLGP